jgi:3-hydroxymyristoyl/3-hydroxydecanoyl-(acyl carrier protein) dehydratase
MDVVDPKIVRESIAPARAEFEITVPQDLFYLQGHCPQQPILPGVIQIHWAVMLGAARLGIKPSFKGIEALKFHRVIKPLTPLSLTLEQAEKTGKLHFSYQSDLGIHSQGRIVFE